MHLSLFRDSQRGTTALFWAARQGHAECARLLLDAGADRTAVDDVRGPRILRFAHVLDES
jgi:ankyrin repeat protein